MRVLAGGQRALRFATRCGSSGAARSAAWAVNGDVEGGDGGDEEKERGERNGELGECAEHCASDPPPPAAYLEAIILATASAPICATSAGAPQPPAVGVAAVAAVTAADLCANDVRTAGTGASPTLLNRTRARRVHKFFDACERQGSHVDKASPTRRCAPHRDKAAQSEGRARIVGSPARGETLVGPAAPASLRNRRHDVPSSSNRPTCNSHAGREPPMRPHPAVPARNHERARFPVRSRRRRGAPPAGWQSPSTTRERRFADS